MASIAVDRLVTVESGHSSLFTNPDEKRKKKKNKKKKKKAPDAADCAINDVSLLFKASEIQQAIKHLKGKDMTVTTDNLIDAVYEVQHHQQEERERHEESKPTSNLLHSDCSETTPLGLDNDDQGDSKGKEIPEEDNQTEEWYQRKIRELQVMCQCCHHHEANIVLLPCGHLACCQYCLSNIQRCRVRGCNQIVHGTKEVFLVDAFS